MICCNVCNANAYEWGHQLAMSLRLKRVYEDARPEDGFRILVDRLWPRGLTKEHVRADLWLKTIAPSPTLRQWFAHDPEKWIRFQARYTKELSNNDEAVQQLITRCQHGNITLLYAAKDTAHNHALVIRDYLVAQPGFQ